MVRICVCLVAVALVASPLPAAIAQSAPAAASSDGVKSGEAKPSRVKLTMEKLKQMRETWRANKPKMKACRREVKAKGLAGDERWFYMQDCMTKS